MSLSDSPTWQEELSDNESEVIDSICDEFESLFKSGRTPRIEDYLTSGSISNRAALLIELVHLEVNYRKQRGERPLLDEYVIRFPDFQQPLAVEFEFLKATAGGGSTVDSPPRDTGVARADEPGRVGRYRLERIIGQGAFGEVWIARDPALHRDVAIKLMRDGKMSATERKLFRDEGQKAARLNAPGVMHVYDVGEEAGRCYLVMELLSGGTLRDYLLEHSPAKPVQEETLPESSVTHVAPEPRPGGLPFAEAVSITLSIARGLDAIHAEKLIHRDLKPSNIMRPRPGSDLWTITDLGLARSVKKSEETLAGVHAVVGTAAYMSPEQARGDIKRIDERTDIFSLGIIFFELLTGRRPFEGDFASVLKQVRDSWPRSPKDFRPDLPEKLETICRKALSPVLSLRYATAQEFADDLVRYQMGQPIKAQPITWWQRHWHLHRLWMLAASFLFGGVVFAATFEEQTENPRQEILIETVPPGAEVTCIPYGPLDGLPKPEEAVKLAKSPGKVKLRGGLYLVVAVLGKRFHEVYRVIPQKGEYPTVYSSTTSSPIEIPEENITDGMAYFSGADHYEAKYLSGAFTCRVAPYFLDSQEVTAKMAKDAGMAEISHQFDLKNRRVADFDDHEVLHNFSWEMAKSWAARMGKRLPDEIEYEYAATNGGKTKFPWGDDPPDFEKWSIDPNDRPAQDRLDTEPPVIGLFSNVGEWMGNPLFYYPRGDRTPGARALVDHVFRGIPFTAADGKPTADTATPRDRSMADKRYPKPWVGFRLARSARPRLKREDFAMPQPAK